MLKKLCLLVFMGDGYWRRNADKTLSVSVNKTK